MQPRPFTLQNKQTTLSKKYGVKEEEAASTNSDQEDVHGQYGDEKDQEDLELEIENFLKSDFNMISICKILDFMFLD